MSATYLGTLLWRNNQGFYLFIYFSDNSGNRSYAGIFRISFLFLWSFKKKQWEWKPLVFAFPEKFLTSVVNVRRLHRTCWQGLKSDAKGIWMQCPHLLRYLKFIFTYFWKWGSNFIFFNMNKQGFVIIYWTVFLLPPCYEFPFLL